MAVFIGIKRRIVMTEPAARALEAVSGFLLVLFGALFVLAPGLLSAG